MKPFIISEHTNNIKGHYPNPQMLQQIAPNMLPHEIANFSRLWITEGIPFAFQEFPILYEIIRQWLGDKLAVHPKNITLIGSARIGYSLSPHPDFGKHYCDKSDLDFTIISHDLFEALVRDFNRWNADVNDNTIKASTPKQAGYWKSNLFQLPKNIKRGFIDTYKIPSFKKYSKAQEINQLMYILAKKLEETLYAPKSSRASVRIYKNWDAFMNQLNLNIRCAFDSLNR